MPTLSKSKIIACRQCPKRLWLEVLTGETLERSGEVAAWISEAHQIAASNTEPEVETGDQCHKPFDCGFCYYCNRDKAVPDFPLDWLPRLRKKQRASFNEAGAEDMRDVPEHLLGPKQRLVRNHTLQDSVFFDQDAAAKALRGRGSPAYFLDFETCNMPVPVWAGIRHIYVHGHLTAHPNGCTSENVETICHAISDFLLSGIRDDFARRLKLQKYRLTAKGKAVLESLQK